MQRSLASLILNFQGFVRCDSRGNEGSPGGPRRGLARKEQLLVEHEERICRVVDPRQQLIADPRRAVGVDVVATTLCWCRCDYIMLMLLWLHYADVVVIILCWCGCDYIMLMLLWLYYADVVVIILCWCGHRWDWFAWGTHWYDMEGNDMFWSWYLQLLL